MVVGGGQTGRAKREAAVEIPVEGEPGWQGRRHAFERQQQRDRGGGMAGRRPQCAPENGDAGSDTTTAQPASPVDWLIFLVIRQMRPQAPTRSRGRGGGMRRAAGLHRAAVTGARARPEMMNGALDRQRRLRMV